MAPLSAADSVRAIDRHIVHQTTTKDLIMFQLIATSRREKDSPEGVEFRDRRTPKDWDRGSAQELHRDSRDSVPASENLFETWEMPALSIFLIRD